MHTRPTVRQTLALVAPLLMALTAALFSPPASAQISEEQARQVRSLLADSHWVAEGPENPERVAYMFTDMECPYCARQWEAMRPFINDADNVTQVRHVIVGILKPQSHAKGAAVLAADDPLRIFRPFRPPVAVRLRDRGHRRLRRPLRGRRAPRRRPRVQG